MRIGLSSRKALVEQAPYLPPRIFTHQAYHAHGLVDGGFVGVARNASHKIYIQETQEFDLVEKMYQMHNLVLFRTTFSARRFETKTTDVETYGEVSYTPSLSS
jgi:hypothetical protein